MEYTPRSGPDAFHAQIQTFPDSDAAHVVATGRVQWDLSDAADVAMLTAGTYKPIVWYRGLLPPGFDPTNPLYTSFTPGPMSAFGVSLVGIARTSVGPFELYDTCAEVMLAAPLIVPDARPLAYSWIWNNADGDFDTIVDTAGDYELLAYEGAAIPPNLRMLPGLVGGVSPADALVVWEFRLYDMPLAQFGAGRIYVPSPASAPPFMPVGADIGTFLFSARADGKTPSAQPGPYPRVFRTKQFEAALDVGVGPPTLNACAFGGPWYGQFVGAVDGGASNAQWVMRALLADVDPTAYTPPNVDAVDDPSCALSSERVLDGVQFTGRATAPTDTFNQILLTYPR